MPIDLGALDTASVDEATPPVSTQPGGAAPAPIPAALPPGISNLPSQR